MISEWEMMKIERLYSRHDIMDVWSIMSRICERLDLGAEKANESLTTSSQLLLRFIETFLILSTLNQVEFVGNEDDKLDELARIYTNRGLSNSIKGRAVGLYALVCINSDIRNGGQSNEARQDTLKYAAASVELFERENEDVPPAQYWILSWAYRQLGEHNRAEQFALQAIRAATGDNSINAFFVTCCFSVAVNRGFSDDVCLAAFNIARSRSAGQLRHLMKPYGIERNYPVTSTQRSGIGTALQDMKRGFKDGIADIVGGGSKEGVAEMIKEEVLKAVVQAFISSIIGS